eukprot:g52734.t1
MVNGLLLPLRRTVVSLPALHICKTGAFMYLFVTRHCFEVDINIISYHKLSTELVRVRKTYRSRPGPSTDLSDATDLDLGRLVLSASSSLHVPVQNRIQPGAICGSNVCQLSIECAMTGGLSEPRDRRRGPYSPLASLNLMLQLLTTAEPADQYKPVAGPSDKRVD